MKPGSSSGTVSSSTASGNAASAVPDALHEAAPPTAKRGWVSRAIGFFRQVFTPVRQRVAPLPEPPAVPAELIDEDMQLEGEGFGALLGRRYTLPMRSGLEPEAVMSQIKRNVSNLSPDEFAAFEKTSGVPWALKLGDEFDIQILGPWNGRVRVIEVAPDAFSFVTLKGHPEAGRIRFAVSRLAPGQLLASITSWARSRDAVVDIGYGKLGIGKNLQAATWTTFLERIAALAGAEPSGAVTVSEQVLEPELKR
jgi:hypothetical protein